ncbi:MAG: NifU family protein [Gemmatimonadota bacterium]
MTLTDTQLLRFSDRAREMVLTFIGDEEEGQDYYVRVAVESPSPLDPRYSIALVEPEEVDPEDRIFDAGGFRVAVDPESADLLEGAHVEWVETLNETGFKVENPNLQPIGSKPLKGPLAERVQTVIDSEINPAVASHGGEIGLVEVRDAVAYIRMSGGCQGCGMARVTLKQGVERMLREAVPEIQGIVDVTDHSAGTNPYYESGA